MADVAGPVLSATAGSVLPSPLVAGPLPPLAPPLPGVNLGSVQPRSPVLMASLCSVGFPSQAVHGVFSSDDRSSGRTGVIADPVLASSSFLPSASDSGVPIPALPPPAPPPAAGQSRLGIWAGKLTQDGAVGPSPRGVSISNLNSTASSVVGPLFGDLDFPSLSPTSVTSHLPHPSPTTTSSHLHRLSPPGSPAPAPACSTPVGGSLSSPPVSWSQRVGVTPSLDRSLSFFPPAPSEGEVIIKPPVDLLRKGNSLWATSLIGGFLHSRLPFKQVESFAVRVWGRFGLQKVFIHDKGYFIFKFQSSDARDQVLASGPWYISNKLLHLKLWKEDINFQQEAATKIPVWVRLYRVPYAYWTPEGLSYLASGIGKPLFMDPLTAKLDPLPYARLCIEISAGVKLPEKLLATILDEDSGQERLLEVRVEFQNKPQVCQGCSSFGHSQLKCPLANFQWVPKASANESPNPPDVPPNPTVVSPTLTAAPPNLTAVPPMATPKGTAGLKGVSLKATPKGDAGPKGVPPKASPKGCSIGLGPKGAQPKVARKGVQPKSLPKGFPPDPLPKALAHPTGTLLGALPKGCLRNPEAIPQDCLPQSLSTPSCLSQAFPVSPNPFSALGDDREEDRESDSSEDEPPSWGPLVRRLKAIDEKASRALSCADVGPPLRAQPLKKKKSPQRK